MLTAGWVFLGLWVGAAAAASAAEPVIGYVDLQRAIVSVDEGKRAKAQIEKVFAQKQAQITAKEQKLKALQDEVKASAASGGAAAQARQAEFQGQLMELQKTIMKEQQQLQELEQKQLASITEKMRATIANIGKAGGYTLILEVQANRLLYAKPHLDITNEVIRAYNRAYK
jgi:outer membrane protein